MNQFISRLGWGGLAVLGAFAFAVIALQHGESIGAIWIVVAAVCIYLIAYRFYSRSSPAACCGWIPRRMTPAYKFNDGLDYVPTNKHVLFGHHFAAIAGAGPLVGPILAAQMGYLPGMLWLLAGVVFAGAVQDFIVLFISTRRDGRSLGDLIKSELGQVPGMIALFGTFFIMLILLAVLALIVVKALAESPWGTFTVAATIPIALFMGVYARYIRPGAHRRSLADRLYPADAVDRRGAIRAGNARDWPAVFTFDGRAADLDADRLRLHCFGAAGLAAAGAARLPVHLPEDRHHRRPGDRRHRHFAGTARCRRSPSSSTAPARSGRAACSPSCSLPSPAARCPASIR